MFTFNQQIWFFRLNHITFSHLTGSVPSHHSGIYQPGGGLGRGFQQLLGGITSRWCQIGRGVAHRQGVRGRSGVGHTTASASVPNLWAAVPHTSQQVVIDIGMAGRDEKYQSIRLIHAQLLHLHLVVLQGLQHQT